MDFFEIANKRIFIAGVLAAFVCWPFALQKTLAQKEVPQTTNAENSNAPGVSPKGTTFTTSADLDDPGDERVFTELSQFLEQHGMVLARTDREK
jgi:hypothetical protein